MRILVTNDDGVTAPGLRVAEAIAEEIAREAAGPDGEVWVVAPAFEQSGVGHALSYTTPIQAERLGPRRFAVSGTPADCVILAMSAFLEGATPDLVISGVNRGHNLADDAVVSGTLGGALEGMLQGVRSIALSQYYRRDLITTQTPEAAFEAARAHGADVVRTLLAEIAGEGWPPERFFNVNFPPVPAAEVLGRRFARQGRRAGCSFDAEERSSPGGRRYFWLRHRVDNDSAGAESDAALCKAGWITMTPMRADYTDHDALARLQARGETV